MYMYIKYHMKFLTPYVAASRFFYETKYSTVIYHFVPYFGNTIRKNTLWGSVLLAKTNKYTLLYIPDKFQGVWMTHFFVGRCFIDP